ncbi:hypothetical protein KM295_04005 [Natronomonas sp. F2-12]|jgi:hypothetical protein|uniref:DUF5518 domain-containing protein n=1 Tax=Natronomonas aquatica TaxID=2841590 RepID=A0A9R1CRT8_9EURY|nr:hypothetical protein [Natronomonas aquatica]MCQ4332667.1 hypothetical protein [Natronomonas aquatica]
MSRDRTLTEASADEIDAEFELDERESTREPTGGSTDGLRGRAAERAGQLFSPKHFLAALLVTVGALFAASTFVPIPGTGLLGVFGAAFAFGLVVEERRYAEAALAGGVVTAASTLLDFAVVAFLGGFGLPIVALSGVLGAVVGGLGTYFGRDLRDGLTRDL